MGAGLALEAKLRFPEIHVEYQAQAKRGLIKIGLVAPYRDQITNKWIMLFPTKNRYKMPSTLNYIAKGLTNLRVKMTDLNISSIALPHLGCENGGLNWINVKVLVNECFSDYVGTVETWEFDNLVNDDLYPELIKMFKNSDLKMNNLELNDQELRDLENYLTKKPSGTIVDLLNIRGFGEMKVKKIIKVIRSIKSSDKINQLNLF